MRPRVLLAGNGIRCVTLMVALTAVCVGAPWDSPPREIVSRSDIFVGQPNVLPSQAMPLGNARVSVDMQGGNVTGFELVAHSAHEFKIANPWRDRAVKESVAGAAWAPSHTDQDTIIVSAEPGKTYRFQAADAQAVVLPLEQTPPLAEKSLGRASIGLGPPCCAPPAGYNPASDRLIGKQPQ